MKTLINKLLKDRITRWGFGTKKFVVLGLIASGVLAGALLTRAGDMVPYHSVVTGQMTITSSGSTIIEETGIGTHLGHFTLVGESDAVGVIWFIVTSANGDKLYGAVVGASEDLTTIFLLIYDGTGRFNGATGHITATLTIDYSTLAYTGTTTGEISTVGASKKK